jgi:hypothetical protein
MLRFILILILFSLLPGCARLSPDLIQSGGNHYNIAMQQTQDEQMLLNLVRLKYRDTPLFLEIASVSSQFKLATGASVNASFSEDPILNNASIGSSINFTEQPTVTYLPLQGDEIAQRMLSPISLDNILLLINSGWNISRVFRLTVQQLNQFSNAPSASGPTPASAPEFKDFKELSNLMRQLQSQRLIHIGYSEINGKSAPVLVISEHDSGNHLIKQFRNLLGLDDSLSIYPIRIANNGQRDSQALNISTRSLMGMMYYLSHSVNVPAKDYHDGIVTSTKSPDGAQFTWEDVTENVFKVNFSSEKPNTYSSMTYYRDKWFYLEDNDLDSKSTFSLLAQLFSLQAGKATGTAPVLTLPVSQ